MNQRCIRAKAGLRASPRRELRTVGRRARGFTILELLVAVTLLSVLAVLSWRGMDAVLSGRASIVERSDSLRELTTLMAQLDDDMRRSWPMRLLGLPVPVLSFHAGNDRESPALILLREAPGGGAAQIQQVVWRLRGGVVERGFGQWVFVAPEAGPSPEVHLVWQPVATGIDAFEFRGWLAGRGWQPASALAVDLAVAAAQAWAGAANPAGTPTGPAGSVGAQPGSGGSGGPGSSGTADAAGTGASGIVPVSDRPPVPLVTGVELVLGLGGQTIHRLFSVAD